jgi:hypothetical protein
MSDMESITLPDITREEGQIAYLVCQLLKRVLLQHGLPDPIQTNEVVEWLDAQLSLLDEHEAILKEAALPASSLYSSPAQPERSGFAAKLRAGQALSASQAMVLMTAKFQNAVQENARLRALVAELGQRPAEGSIQAHDRTSPSADE